MKILVINSGSSTVKFQVIEIEDGSVDLSQQRKIARGFVDRIGTGAAFRFEATAGPVKSESVPIADHGHAVRLIINWVRSLSDQLQIDAVGHRVVHGGAEFTEPVLIDAGVMERIEALSNLAPLHNPPAVSGIRAAGSILGASIPMVAAFDTAFHHTIPDQAAIYAIPYELSEKHRIRRYGFHGLAHQYSLLRYCELAGKQHERIKIVTLHLGNGSSACAIDAGKSVDTSMGFTPLEGLVMGTRSGDLDPALVSYLAREENVDAAKVENWLNQRSGLLGISGLSNDMRELTAAYDMDPRARLAVDVFCYRARKYVGAYLAALGGAEAVIFSGGIGENSPAVRHKICTGMEWCKLVLEPALNNSVSARDSLISAPDCGLKGYVIHTDEETLLARETAALMRK
jgi:acetate kinase